MSENVDWISEFIFMIIVCNNITKRRIENTLIDGSKQPVVSFLEDILIEIQKRILAFVIHFHDLKQIQ